MINAITLQIPGAAAAVGGVQAAAGTKTAIAVRPSHAIYAHFQHVWGVPAPDGVNGVSVSRLKILDSMIERMRQLRQNRPNVNSAPDEGGAAARLDKLIEMLNRSLNMEDAQMRQQGSLPYKNALSPGAGAFFSLNV
ncbi:MAG: hypothetical protein LBG72_00950 [Spirochaetaceae bacterium]|jgi:hypothetical protein|nr:hypothetical protein [Spirochaetaceae bacterium]